MDKITSKPKNRQLYAYTHILYTHNLFAKGAAFSKRCGEERAADLSIKDHLQAPALLKTNNNN